VRWHKAAARVELALRSILDLEAFDGEGDADAVDGGGEDCASGGGGGGGGDDGGSNNDDLGDAVEGKRGPPRCRSSLPPRVVFDAAVFVASSEDMQLRGVQPGWQAGWQAGDPSGGPEPGGSASALAHAMAAFRARAWGLEDDCELAGDPALLPWDLAEDRAGAERPSEDRSSEEAGKGKHTGFTEEQRDVPSNRPGKRAGRAGNGASGDGRGGDGDGDGDGDGTSDAELLFGGRVVRGPLPLAPIDGLTDHTNLELTRLLRGLKASLKTSQKASLKASLEAGAGASGAGVAAAAAAGSASAAAVPFAVCRPGYGWDTTLAHRRRVGFPGSAGLLEQTLLAEHAGLDARPQAGGGLAAYLDAWNEALLEDCDALAVFPATAGRVREGYCGARGLRGGDVASNQRVVRGYSRHQQLQEQEQEQEQRRRCTTVDARLLGAPRQLVSSAGAQDGWFRELEVR